MITPTTDIDKINSVLKHPDIWPFISGDASIDDFEPPINDETHYLFDEGVLFILHPEGNDWKIHANITKDSRFKAVEAANEALDYGFNKLSAGRIIATIPSEYGHVYGFALKMGMTDEGVTGDVHLLTLERQKWAL